jgi:GntR family transcriptional regulator/MocR family aminotransferase
VEGAAAGLHVVARLPLPAGRAEADLVARAAAAGLGVYALGAHHLDPPRDGRAGLVLGYATLPEATIRRGIQRLAEVAADPAPTASSP